MRVCHSICFYMLESRESEEDRKQAEHNTANGDYRPSAFAWFLSANSTKRARRCQSTWPSAKRSRQWCRTEWSNLKSCNVLGGLKFSEKANVCYTLSLPSNVFMSRNWVKAKRKNPVASEIEWQANDFPWRSFNSGTNRYIAAVIRRHCAEMNEHRKEG